MIRCAETVEVADSSAEHAHLTRELITHFDAAASSVSKMASGSEQVRDGSDMSSWTVRLKLAVFGTC